MSVGVAAELYYVRDGVVNDYALSFVLPVQTDVDTIYFDWQSLRTSPLDHQVVLLLLLLLGLLLLVLPVKTDVSTTYFDWHSLHSSPLNQ